LSIVFRGSWDSIENWLEPKIEPPLQMKFSLPKSMKRSVASETTPLIHNTFKVG